MIHIHKTLQDVSAAASVWSFMRVQGEVASLGHWGHPLFRDNLDSVLLYLSPRLI